MVYTKQDILDLIAEYVSEKIKQDAVIVACYQSHSNRLVSGYTLTFSDGSKFSYQIRLDGNIVLIANGEKAVYYKHFIDDVYCTSIKSANTPNLDSVEYQRRNERGILCVLDVFGTIPKLNRKSFILSLLPCQDSQVLSNYFISGLRVIVGEATLCIDFAKGTERVDRCATLPKSVCEFVKNNVSSKQLNALPPLVKVALFLELCQSDEKYWEGIAQSIVFRFS